MIDALPIDEVARRTGLTSRALRFYEARGLLRPLRAASDRRFFGPGELARIHQIVTLKKAGLSLAQIKRLLDRREIDLAELLNDRLAALTALAIDIERTRTTLRTALSRIESGEPLDVATLCSLIRDGESNMSETAEAWKAVSDKYMDEAAKADFAEAGAKLGEMYDQQAYAQQWRELGQKVKAALPLDPASDDALGLVREWFSLLAPFTAIATPAMWQGTIDMYEKMGEWQGGSADPGFDGDVWAFIRSATTAAREAGHDIGPLPAWMQTG